ncbi:N-acetylglucosamine-6-phosphate deacetylase [Anaerobacillus alkaliphilus]|uniref:N-acetylglucosamine-6-phosphate deacetylase n=1 Tax=Anaerobacillus alkaliphilus TaxID=1548597 RepID=A0A4Q0VUU0_9BACI|nr:N-acetylglucosamine-6-phosphate deacetylase [Anaerobacillus alkaliphilus]RXJ02550.1 N-acetylglucosamine-6-phosphate deacetylase [Anaerobacillus alkaliphilus]
MKEQLALTNIQVYTENEVIENGFIKIKSGEIAEIGCMDIFGNDPRYEKIEFPPGNSALPGMIDLHIHGVNGTDMMDATEEALRNMAISLPREGTTSFLVTTITQEVKAIEKALRNTAIYMNSQEEGAEILGVHLEGPFISKKRAGAQPHQYIRKPDLTLFQTWQKIATGAIKVVTLAPEEENGLELIRYLKENDVVASIGHSDAYHSDMEEAIKAGASHITHLYNGMRGLHHREPGVAGTALANEDLYVEMIVDGIHIHPAIVKSTYNAKKAEKIILITDSIRAKGLADGSYDLGGQEVTVQNGKAVLEDGTLAGSILKMDAGVRNMLEFTGCTIEEMIQMTAGNPAKRLNVYHRKGSLKVGKDADLIILDQNNELLMTFCRGKLVYRKGDLE